MYWVHFEAANLGQYLMVFREVESAVKPLSYP